MLESVTPCSYIRLGVYSHRYVTHWNDWSRNFVLLICVNEALADLMRVGAFTVKIHKMQCESVEFAHFKLQTRTEQILVQKILVADDNAIVILNAGEEMNVQVEKISGSIRSFSLTTIKNKAKCFFQQSSLVPLPRVMLYQERQCSVQTVFV